MLIILSTPQALTELIPRTLQSLISIIGIIINFVDFILVLSQMSIYVYADLFYFHCDFFAVLHAFFLFLQKEIVMIYFC